MGNQVSTPMGMGANNLKDPSPTPAAAPKPCCVCTDEKASRDKCMLFSNAKDPLADCAPTIETYKICMKGFGFELP
ncbi:COX17 protein [Calycina marina]|uniref:COX17 protein n=1 Tax=Calycina marina TaxID=1763456 RepID=A0A9P8CFV4_9HELO|nr:COX17 protein [Calycina marina]